MPCRKIKQVLPASVSPPALLRPECVSVGQKGVGLSWKAALPLLAGDQAATWWPPRPCRASLPCLLRAPG